MKKIGFLSFGHWTPSAHSQTRSASDALLQSIELAVAAEELGADGAYFRVHHFARQLGSPFPLLAAVGARTSRIEIGTAVIDMRYENPMYMAEDAGAADLIAGGRLQLGISRGSPEQVIDGWRYFGYAPEEGQTDADMARHRAEVLLEVLRGEGFAKPNPTPMFPNPPGLLRVEPHSEGLRDRIWWGAATNATAEWAAKLGMNLQSSTLKFDEGGKPFHIQQADQIRLFREAWKAAGHQRDPRVSVSRSIFALVDDRDRIYFRARQPERRPDRLHRGEHAGDLRPQLRRRAGCAHRAAQAGRSRCGGRHAAAHRPQPARRRLQCARDRGHPDPGRPGTGLALRLAWFSRRGGRRGRVGVSRPTPRLHWCRKSKVTLPSGVGCKACKTTAKMCDAMSRES
jgi:alkanesulfonate monooxygenase SsuD/methylene tetrahydromethanopterin reductase-like flavin-dependent oxidoreductase (luciferase family)